MSGRFYFSIIPKDWSKLRPDQELPFSCTVNKVSNLGEIISNFINDPCKGVLKLDELEEVDPSEYGDEEEDPKKYILDVWSKTL